MRICLLQSRYPADHVLRQHDDYPDPGRWVNHHDFHHRFIDKDKYRSQVDAAVAESFDLYVNFMWGQPEDEVAGLEATRYLEWLNVPVLGLRSHILQKSKLDFYKAARERGSPPVPSDDPNTFPGIVKAARSCASQYLSADSICHTALERDATIADLSRQLEPGRLRRTPIDKSWDCSWPLEDVADDIVVQEFIPGTDYSVVIIEFGIAPIPLNPTVYNYPPIPGADSPNRFLSFDIKFNPELTETLVCREDNPDLFDLLQKVAVEAYEVNGMIGGSWGNVDIRVKPDGKPVVIEVNPMPAIFLPRHQQWEDPVIERSLPGGHRALVNIAIASFLKSNDDEARLMFIASEYDRLAPRYDSHLLPRSSAREEISKLISQFSFEGSLLDLACGTGIVGSMIGSYHRRISPSDDKACQVGIDLSAVMAHSAKQEGYDQVLVGPIQYHLPKIQEQFDHIICYSAIHFVTHFEVSLVLSRCFQLANRSVTIGVDEIPDEYNERIRAKESIKLMTSCNHVQEVRDFGVPLGWRLALDDRYWGWKSPSTGVDVFTTLFHFERDSPLG